MGRERERERDFVTFLHGEGEGFGFLGADGKKKKRERRMKNRSGRNEETAYDTAVNCEPTKEERERGRGKSWTVERELSDSR